MSVQIYKMQKKINTNGELDTIYPVTHVNAIEGLNDTLGSYLPLTGGTLSGTLNTIGIISPSISSDSGVSIIHNNTTVFKTINNSSEYGVALPTIATSSVSEHRPLFTIRPSDGYLTKTSNITVNNATGELKCSSITLPEAGKINVTGNQHLDLTAYYVRFPNAGILNSGSIGNLMSLASDGALVKLNNTSYNSSNNKLTLTNLATTTLNDCTIGSSKWGTIPTVRSNDGVMEIGKYIDFHADSSATNDYDGRIQGQADGGTILIPKKSGTIALTSDVPTNLGHTLKLKSYDNVDKSFDGSQDIDLTSGVRKAYIAVCDQNMNVISDTYHKRLTAMIGSDKENTAGWYKFCSGTLNNYSNVNLMFAVTQTYSSYNSGILELQLRSDNGSLSVKVLGWLTRYGFTSNCVMCVIDGMNYTCYISLSTSQYGRILFEIISNADRIDKNSSTTLYNTNTPESSAPTPTIYSNDIGNVNYANKATLATNLDSAPVISIGTTNPHNFKITVGGKTSEEFAIAYVPQAGNANTATYGFRLGDSLNYYTYTTINEKFAKYTPTSSLPKVIR